MNEQRLADLFSEQIDRLLEGDASATVPDVDDLQELLELGNQISHTHFQASTAAQATFQSLLAGWFGLANGGSPMTILSLSKAWFISIITVVVGAGFVAVTVANIFIFGGEEVVEVPTVENTVQPDASPTEEPTEMPTSEAPATTESAPDDTDSPDASPTDEPPPLVFVSSLGAPSLCGGAYTTQSTLVNYGGLPITDAALIWEVIEGMEFVDNVNLGSDDLAEPSAEDGTDTTDASDPSDTDTSAVSTLSDTPLAYSNYASFNQISVDQEVDLDIEVKVNDDWWEQADGTEIKVKLSVKSEVEISNDAEYRDHNRGHGNDPDGYDEDNPGRGRGRGKRSGDSSSSSQVITIVKEGAQWITLSGVAHPYDDQSWLVDGTIVVIDGCTGLPLNLVAGVYVNVIGFLQPDGTFIAINIINIDTGVTIINFDSGVPMGGDDGDDGGSGGHGGSKKGGSKKGGSKKGGSKKGGS